LSPVKIMFIVAVVLLLLGPDKLPEVAHKLGSSWRALKRLQERVETEVRQAIPDLPNATDLARIARSPVHLLNQLADRVDLKEENEAATANFDAASGTRTDASTETSTETPTDAPTDAPIIVPKAVPPSTPRPLTDVVLPPDPSLN